jgi:hypothetical protein
VRRPKGLTVTAVLMLITALGTLLFWVVFLADLDAQRGGELALRSDAWFAWEVSFPLADGWMAAVTLLGAIGLLRLRSWGVLFSLVSGGAMVFLGLMDILFFLQNDLYLPLTGETAIELGIHVWLVAFGLVLIRYVWRQRRNLL